MERQGSEFDDDRSSKPEGCDSEQDGLHRQGVPDGPASPSPEVERRMTTREDSLNSIFGEEEVTFGGEEREREPAQEEFQVRSKARPEKDLLESRNKKETKMAQLVRGSTGRNLWVCGLSPNTRVKDLKALFSKYGEVCGAKIVTSTRDERCYGFVTMEHLNEARLCIEKLHKTELHSMSICVEFARSNSRPPQHNAPSLRAHNAHSESAISALTGGRENRSQNTIKILGNQEENRQRHAFAGPRCGQVGSGFQRRPGHQFYRGMQTKRGHHPTRPWTQWQRSRYQKDREEHRRDAQDWRRWEEENEDRRRREDCLMQVREKLRREQESIEREKQELVKLKLESQKLERERLQLKRAQLERDREIERRRLEDVRNKDAGGTYSRRYDSDQHRDKSFSKRKRCSNGYPSDQDRDSSFSRKKRYSSDYLSDQDRDGSYTRKKRYSSDYLSDQDRDGSYTRKKRYSSGYRSDQDWNSSRSKTNRYNNGYPSDQKRHKAFSKKKQYCMDSNDRDVFKTRSYAQEQSVESSRGCHEVIQVVLSPTDGSRRDEGNSRYERRGQRSTTPVSEHRSVQYRPLDSNSHADDWKSTSVSDGREAIADAIYKPRTSESKNSASIALLLSRTMGNNNYASHPSSTIDRFDAYDCQNFRPHKRY